ncbi:hypothetical protein SteCoe_37295 [Stentor coeruleus]|uniref:Uncharacterized protein n=1 Tax=Stentor coeruleus TaxID=5963 RepID=A0A1R2ANA1_9CILI|nr:hypothetical protein SteCoe_37295 [Stentor coeruleus]
MNIIPKTKKNLIIELSNQNANLEEQLKLLKKQYDNLVPKHSPLDLTYPSKIQLKLIENLKKKEDSYFKEFQQLKARVEQISSNYPSKLEKKIARKQEKLDKMLARNNKTDFSNEIAVEEKDFSKDIRSCNNTVLSKKKSRMFGKYF